MTAPAEPRSVEASTGVLLTITTGKFLADSFGEFHEAADVVMGQPLMTHQFASEAVEQQMRREAQRQHPWTADETLLDDFPALEGLPQDEVKRLCQKWVAQQSERHGQRHTLVSPPETRHVPLTEGLPAKFGGTA